MKLFDVKQIPLGTCDMCLFKQSDPGEGGKWNTCAPKSHEQWICDNCITKYNVKFYLGCEWCGYDDVIWLRGHTYSCPRCEQLKIGQWEKIHT